MAEENKKHWLAPQHSPKNYVGFWVTLGAIGILGYGAAAQKNKTQEWLENGGSRSALEGRIDDRFEVGGFPDFLWEGPLWLQNKILYKPFRDWGENAYKKSLDE